MSTMQLTWQPFDVAPVNAAIEQVVAGQLDTLPRVVITRGKAETWLVSYAPLQLATPPQWQQTRQDEHVLIPLFPYLLPGQLELALATALQLGAQAAQSVPAPVRRLHIVAGQPVCQVEIPDAGPRWRYWFGFGFMV